MNTFPKTFPIAIILAATLAASGLAVAQESSKAPSQAAGAAQLEAARGHYSLGDWERARALFDEAYGAALDSSDIKAAAALESANLLWEQGDYDEAEVRVKDAMERAQKLGLDHAIGRLLMTLGHIEASQGKLREAENTLQICIKMAAEQDDKVFSALCRLNRRLVRTLRGKAEGSEAEFRADVAALKAAGTPETVGTSLSKTAELYHKNGDLPRALALLEEAEAMFAAGDNVPNLARNQMRFARLYQEQGRHDEARARLQGLVAQFEAMKNRPGLVSALSLTARDAELRGEYREALDGYRRALKVAKETKSPQLIANGHLAICEFTGAKSADDLRPHCQAAASQFRSTRIPALTARALAAQARIDQAANRHDSARTLYLEVIEILEKHVDPASRDELSLATQHANLCQIERATLTDRAFQRCDKALKTLDALPEDVRQANHIMINTTVYAAGVTAAHEKKFREAVENLERAAKMAMDQSSPNPVAAADALLRLGVMQLELIDHRAHAPATFERAIALTDTVTEAAKSPILVSTRIQLLTQLAQVRLNGEEWAAAVSSLDALIAEAAAAQDHKSVSWAYSGLSRAQLRLGDQDAAKKALEAGLPAAKKSGDKEMIELFEQNLKQFKR